MKRLLIFSNLVMFFIVLNTFVIGLAFGASYPNTVIKTIPLSNDPGGIAVTPDGDYIYAIIHDEGIVNVIQTLDNTIVETINIVGDLAEPVITPDGEFVYISDFGNGEIKVIQTSDNTLVDTVLPNDDCQTYIHPSCLSITPNGETIYASNSCNPCNTVSVIQTSDNTMIECITVGPTDGTVGACPQGNAITPGGNFLYVANTYDYTDPDGSNDGTVSVIQTSDNTVVETIFVGGNPMDVAITPNGEYVYVSVSETTVLVIQTSDNTIVDTIESDDFNRPIRMAVTPDGAYVYAVNHHGNTVSVIQTSDNTIVDNIYVGGGIFHIDIAPDGNTVYVGAGDDNKSIAVIGFGPPDPPDGFDLTEENFPSSPDGNIITYEDGIIHIEMVNNTPGNSYTWFSFKYNECLQNDNYIMKLSFDKFNTIDYGTLRFGVGGNDQGVIIDRSTHSDMHGEHFDACHHPDDYSQSKFHADIDSGTIVFDRTGNTYTIYVEGYEEQKTWVFDGVDLGSSPALFIGTEIEEGNYLSVNLTHFEIDPCFIPPVAEAGDNQTISLGETLQLDANDSYDPNGDYPLSYEWEIIAQPPGSYANLSDQDVLNPTFTADLAGDYTIQLIVMDDTGLSSEPDQIKITLFDSTQITQFIEEYLRGPPPAPGGPPPGPPPLRIEEGWTGRIAFDLADISTVDEGPETNNVSVKDGYDVIQGPRMMTTDAIGFDPDLHMIDSAKLDVSIVGHRRNFPDPYQEHVLMTIVNGSPTPTVIYNEYFDHPDPNIPGPKNIEITLDPNLISTQGRLELKVEAPNEYPFDIIPEGENNFLIIMARLTVTLKDNQAPIANAGPDQTNILGEYSIFNGTSSFDPDGDIISHEWDFGDGYTGSGNLVSHLYALPGEYEVSLTVTDDDGDTDTAFTSATILTPAEATQEFIYDIEDLNLNGGTENSLVSKLESAIDSVEKGQDNAAINKLNAFINSVEAQRGKKITDYEADVLIAKAQRIIDALLTPDDPDGEGDGGGDV
ncbi:PKD domain-containing protein [Thermodesulfobacteriota bacterium]